MGTSSQEKRRAQRVAADLRLRSALAEGMMEMETVNISAVGASCRSPRLLEPMTCLDVVLDLPGRDKGAPVTARAVVVRVEHGTSMGPGPPYRLALWFQQMTDEDRGRLRRYLGCDGN